MRLYIVALFYLVGLSYSNVVEFNHDMPSLIESGQALLVSFYAPWCGHCQQLAPTWKKVGERLKDASIIVGKLDCTLHQDVATKYAIRGFPTIKIFRAGRAIDFDGSRDENSIINWAKRATGPSILTTKHKLVDMIEKHKTTPVFLYNGNAQTELWQKFQTVAEKYVPNISFFKNKSSSAEADKISVLKDGSEYIFDGSSSKLPSWVKAEKESSFQPLTMKLARQYSKEARYTAVIITGENEESNQLDVVRSLALDRSNPVDDISFTFASSKMSQRTIDHLTYRECQNGELIVLPQGEHSGQYYLKELDVFVTTNDIRQFMEDIKSGKEELNGKSAVGRLISDFVFGFYRLFKENPILGGLIIGLPTILISFIIWGVCSVPEGNYEEYEDSGSGSEADVSSNEEPNTDILLNDEPNEEPIGKEYLLNQNIRRRQIYEEQSSDEDEDGDKK